MTTGSEIIIKDISGITKVLAYEMQSEFLIHPTAKLICEIEKEFDTTPFLDEEKLFHIVHRKTGENLFTGYVDEVTIEERQLDYYVLSVCFRAGSVLLDKAERYRSYQDVAMRYKALIDKVAEEIPEVFVKCVLKKDTAIERPLIQYGETNWEFIKRIASKQTEPVFVDEAEVEPKVYVGYTAGGSLAEISGQCIGEGVSNRYYTRGEADSTHGKNAYYYYKVLSENSYRIGQQVNYRNSQFYIFSKEAKLVQEEIWYTYKVVRDAYLRVPVSYNTNFVGATIQGNIEETTGETMKIKFRLKDEPDGMELYAYDWKPEVGNLMYCMPQKGTTVSLYFPSNNEQEAYAINCIRKSGGRTFETNAKTFLTEDSKFMILAPEAMHFCAVPKVGETYSQLSIMDNLETLLASSADIDISTEKGMTLSAPTVDFFCHGNIGFQVGTVYQEEDKFCIKDVTSTITVSSALLNMYAQKSVTFQLRGTSNPMLYPIIMDVPEVAEADKRALWKNVLIGGLVTAAVVAACVFALPAALGALGVAAATATTVATGAAIGAATTGIYAMHEQFKSDKERGVVTSWNETLGTMALKTVVGAVEGGVTSLVGLKLPGYSTNLLGSQLQKITSEWGKKLSKAGIQAACKLIENQAGSFINKTGEVSLNMLKVAFKDEYYYDFEDAKQTYLDGVKEGAVSTVLDLPLDSDFTKNFSKGVSGLLDSKYGSTAWYQKIDSFNGRTKSTLIDVKNDVGSFFDTKFGENKLYEFAEDVTDGFKKYSDVEEVGRMDAVYVYDRSAKRELKDAAKDELKELPDSIADLQRRADSELDELLNMRQTREELKDQIRSGEGDIPTLKYQLRQMKRQIKNQDEKVYQKTQGQIRELQQRRADTKERIAWLKDEIWDSMKDSWAVRWKGVSAGTLKKLTEDTVKNTEKKAVEAVIGNE